MSTTLGLDLGPNSIGWALVDESQSTIVAAGVRAFPEGVDNFGSSKEVSRNEQRRIARAMRRQTQRRRQRKARLRQALIDNGLWPADVAEQERLHALDPYALRTRALDEKLTPHEIGRILLHLNQRRGFLSLRKRSSADKETGKMLAEISELSEHMHETGARTLGEYLHVKARSLDHRHRQDDDHVRSRHTRRAMLEEEFFAIWSAQQAHHPELLTDRLRVGALGRLKNLRKPTPKHDPSRRGLSDAEAFGLHGMIFFQRPVYWPASVVGLCELEPKQKRCRLAHRLHQRCRLLQEVNNLRYIDPDTRSEQAMTGEQRTLLLAHLATREKMTFDAIRKTLGFDEGIRFNLEKGKRPSLKGMTTDWKMAKVVGKGWHARDEEDKNAVVGIVLTAEADEDAAMDDLIERHGFTEQQADAMLRVDLLAGYGSLSETALRKLLPHLEAGLPYMAGDAENSALHAAGYLRRDQLRRRVFDRLPIPERAADCKIGNIPNPVVKRALVELRKVVNAIIREYGKPDAIHVEMARSVQLGGRKRREYINAMRDREKQRAAAADEIRALGLRVTGEAITQYLLWGRQNRECLYCGRTISQSQLFGGDIDVDHVLPYSRSIDDSQANKVVCHRRCNATKGQRTVHEWLADSDPERYERVCQQAQGLVKKQLLSYGTYRRILQPSVDLDDFTNRQLVDTAYITRATVEYLHCLFQADHFVLGLKGQYTAKLRYQWGLETILSELPDSPAWEEDAKLRPGKKNRADHRHHAIDAVVLALTNRSRLQELAQIRRVAGQGDVNLSTGEVLEVAPPWQGFREGVVEAVRDIRVSHRVRRGVSGGLHNDTFYGPVLDKTGQRTDGLFVVRKPVAELSANEVPKIRDPGIRRIVMNALASEGIEVGRAKKPDPATFRRVMSNLAMPSGVPIRKVRIFYKNLTVRPIRDGTSREAWVRPDSNHHICIFEWEEVGKTRWEMHAVSRLEAARRARARQAIIRRTPPPGHVTIPPGARFVMSLAAGEMVLAEYGDRTKLLVFKSAVSTERRINFREHTDARPGRAGQFPIKASTLVGRKVTKVTIDPLGRLRWAND